MKLALLMLSALALLPGCQGKCELDDDLRLFAGEAARDCGEAATPEARASVDECVVGAFEAKDAFIARYRAQGEDSQLVTAVAANSVGAVKLFQWDSSPCGGPGCDPVTDVQACEQPSVEAQTSEDAQALPIQCASYGPAQRICS